MFGKDELDRFEQDSSLILPDTEGDLIRLAYFFEKRLSKSEAEGAAITIGKFAYPYVKNEFMDELKFREAQFRILPIDERIRTGLTRLVESVLNPAGVSVRLEASDTDFRMTLEDTLQMNPVETGVAACLSGLILECCSDISGGKTYRCELENRRELCLFKKPIGH